MSRQNESLNAWHSAHPRAKANRRLAWILALAAAGFLGFGFGLAPLYNTFCEVTGLNGKTETATTKPGAIDLTRIVTVEFTSTVMPGLPWHFEPEQRRLRVHPGEPATAAYAATNLGDRAIDGQAIMSVSPEVAATHFKKIECFCFHKQALSPKETRILPLAFFVARDLPRDIRTITVSYAAFPVPKAN